MVRQSDRNRPEKYDPVSPDVIIFGSGACARRIAANLDADGVSSWLVAGDDVPASTNDKHASYRQIAASLDRCRGFPGTFALELRADQGPVSTTARAIVIAEDCRHTPNLLPYALDPGPRIVSISVLESILASTDTSPVTGASTVAFLCGWQVDCHPTVAKRMLDACCRVQQRLDGCAFFLTGNLKVAADGAQQRAGEAQQAGAVFLKFNDAFPTLTAIGDHRYSITGVDQLLGAPFHLDVDWIVVDEAIQPAHQLEMLAQRLGIDRDEHGFTQKDNVRRMNNATNRHGIFVAGGGRGVLSVDEQLTDADQVSLEVLTFLGGIGQDERPAAVVRTGRCARCLTCHRICPHLAIDIDPRITIVPQACQRCGICLASCPAQAIEMDDMQIDDRLEPPQQSVSQTADDAPKPARITVFGCSRSAGRAFALARLSGCTLTTGLQFVEVPCGGGIATRHILAAFEAGAHGVMLCPCHTDNCQSQIGSRVARKRAALARDLLRSAGIDKDRLRIAPLAANMGIELAHMIDAFANELDTGTSP